MFTGIVENLGEVTKITPSGDNQVFTISSSITSELKVDQSISHNGVCLTVSAIVGEDQYQVVAVPETLKRSNLSAIKVGDMVNLERSMVFGGRVDGHLVQGHVDQTAICKEIHLLDGSWEFVFEFTGLPAHPLIEKGSICVNGVSLTCYNLSHTSFQVSIIPYTYEHTNFKLLTVDSLVNIEFDMIGKYIQVLTS
jgi:riboflavin synthase